MNAAPVQPRTPADFAVLRYHAKLGAESLAAEIRASYEARVQRVVAYWNDCLQRSRECR